MGRINAWWFAYNLANARPLLGGGANTFTKELFYLYAPEPENFHDVHSIYFEMLGEQGYPGLLIFIAMLFFSYRNCVWVGRQARGDPDLKWAYDLSRMLQASFVAYGVGGAFLGLAYFDLLYHLVALSVLVRVVVEKELVELFEKAPKDYRFNDYYNHSNEPVHHVPYLFAYIGKPWLTQKYIREVMEKAYSLGPHGLCGNEDVGQMSAWYVFNAMGFHPVAPGDNVYVFGSPLFEEVVVRSP